MAIFTSNFSRFIPMVCCNHDDLVAVFGFGNFSFTILVPQVCASLVGG